MAHPQGVFYCILIVNCCRVSSSNSTACASIRIPYWSASDGEKWHLANIVSSTQNYSTTDAPLGQQYSIRLL